MAKRRQKFLSRMKKKFLLLMFLMSGFFVFLVGWIWHINNADGKKYEKIVLAQQSYDSIEIPYRRGDILDRNGTQLATSEKVYNLILEPKNILQSDEVRQAVTEALIRFFKVDQKVIDQALADSGSLYKKLLQSLTYDEIAPFQEFLTTKEGKQVKGIWFEDQYKRFYPHGSLACHVIGFTVGGNVGQGGIEGYYNSEMNGINGREYGYLTEDMTLKRTTKAPMNGYNIVSTIDANAQGIVEKKIDEFMKETGARNVSALVMNPNSGEVLAMANSNRFDLNEPYENSAIRYLVEDDYIDYLMEDQDVQHYFEKPTEEVTEQVQSEETATQEAATEAAPKLTEKELEEYQKRLELKNILQSGGVSVDEKLKSMTDDFKLICLNKAWRNYIISDGFEPGSTYKTFTIAGAMEDSVLNGDETFYCDGDYEVEDWVIKCHNHAGHGTINIEQSLMYSCNVALMQIAQKEGRKTFSKYQDVFGFGKTTHVDLAGEAAGLIYSEEKLNPVELATSSFGQGLTVTMMQIGTAFCSVINGGNYYEPHLVRQILDENGGVINNIEPTVLRKTISSETSDFMRQALFAVVDSGTAQKAKVEGYTIGGKTGTAEKLPRGNHKYVLSFIGFAPVENPQVVVYVTVDEPKVEDQANSGMGTIIAHSIFEELLPYMNIYQTETEESKGDPNVGDQIATPVYEGSIPGEEQDGLEDDIQKSRTDEGEPGQDIEASGAGEPQIEQAGETQQQQVPEGE